MPGNAPYYPGMRSVLSTAVSDYAAAADGRSLSARFLLPSSSPIFGGHFPGMPVIPAVYQVALCAEAVGRLGPYSLAGIVKSRFSRMCVPETAYSLRIALAEKEHGTEASCGIYNTEDNGVCSKIVLMFTNSFCR